MSRHTTFLILIAFFVLTGCATQAKDAPNPSVSINEESSGGQPSQAEKAEIEGRNHKPAKDEVAVFGRISLVEKVNGLPMPVLKQDGYLYLKKGGLDKNIKITCLKSGRFGVYLPAGSYRVRMVKVNGFTFFPDIAFDVPASEAAVYTGTIMLDGAPSGVESGTGKSLFIYTIQDEYAGFMTEVRRSSPGQDIRIARAIFRPEGTVATGSYPAKVARAKDLERGFSARTKEAEEAIEGSLIVLTYFINPIWIIP